MRECNVIQSSKIRFFGIWLLGISLVMAGVLAQTQAGAPAGANSGKQCVRRDGLSFNGVGLWSRLPTVLKYYGQPLHVEPMDGVTNNRVYAHYIYKDIKLFIFNSIVWQIDVLTADISAQSGVRLMSDFSAVEKALGVKLSDPISGQNNKFKFKVPICPPLST
jgi:hypothetical protein